MAVYLVLLFLLVQLRHRHLQPVLEGIAVHRPAAAQSRAVHSDGMGRAAGASRCVVRNSVSIVPSVAGEVIDVPVEANKPLKAGDVLFRIDPVPYEAQVNAIEAQLKLSATRLAQMTQLFERDSGRGFDVEQRQSEVDQLKAQLESAKWNLDKTVVRAPADGYATNIGLRKGARVANLPLAPVMAFIDTSDTIIGAEIAQIDARYIQPGQPVEATFKFRPGKIYSGKVESILQAVATGQVQASGLAVTPKDVVSLAVCRSHPARRCGFRPELARRQHRRRRHFHRTRQGGPRHPKGAAAADWRS